MIKADFDGSNPKLEHAYTIISAYCGDEKTPIEIDSSTIVKSNDNIEYQLIKVDSYRYRLSIYHSLLIYYKDILKFQFFLE